MKAIEQLLRDASAEALIAAKRWLLMHGLPQWPNLDVLGIEGVHHLVAVRSHDVWIHLKRREPTIVLADGDLRLQCNPRNVRQVLRVEVEDLASTSNPSV